ncbi:MAG: hypothetical protein J5993_03445 [Clostridia bacterium]|nr:hypothetical protein [Clostridia bacterium]
MSNSNRNWIGAIIEVAGIVIAVVSVFVGLGAFSSDFSDFTVPFILIGISLGIIISALGVLIRCTVRGDDKKDEEK